MIKPGNSDELIQAYMIGPSNSDDLVQACIKMNNEAEHLRLTSSILYKIERLL